MLLVGGFCVVPGVMIFFLFQFLFYLKTCINTRHEEDDQRRVHMVHCSLYISKCGWSLYSISAPTQLKAKKKCYKRRVRGGHWLGSLTYWTWKMSAARAAVVVLCNKWAEYSSLFSRAVDCVLSVTGYYISSRMRIVALKKHFSRPFHSVNPSSTTQRDAATNRITSLNVCVYSTAQQQITFLCTLEWINVDVREQVLRFKNSNSNLKFNKWLNIRFNWLIAKMERWVYLIRNLQRRRRRRS